MTDLPALTGPSRAPASGGKPKHLVVLLHGLGADGQDLLGLSQVWGQFLPDAEFIAPNAPFHCDMAPMGYQWFSVQNRDPAAIRQGVLTAAPILDAYLDEQLASRGLDERQLVLAGFSQGCMMALHIAPRRANPVACVLGYSGRLIAPEDLAGQIKHPVPVFLTHGQVDEVVPPASLPHALDHLSRHGFPAIVLSRPGLGHSIDEEGAMAGGGFAARHLALADRGAA